MKWGIFTYLTIINLLASVFGMLIIHEMFHLISFQPYASSICLDFGEENMAHVSYKYPPDAEPWVERIAANNEKWATLIGYVTFVILFLVNNRIIIRLCQDD